MPSYAGWRTLRHLGWHIAGAESRYYLPSLQLEQRDRAHELFEELERPLSMSDGVVETMQSNFVGTSTTRETDP